MDRRLHQSSGGFYSISEKITTLGQGTRGKKKDGPEFLLHFCSFEIKSFFLTFL
jgi:hypothetical protein